MNWKTLLENLLIHDRIGDALLLLDKVCKQTNDSYNGDTLIAMRGQHARLQRSISQGSIRAEDQTIGQNRLRIAANQIAGDLQDFAAPADWVTQFARPASAPNDQPPAAGSSERDVILFLGASQSAAPDLDIANEFNQLTRRLEQKDADFRIRSNLETTIDNLQDVLLDREPTILHLSAHGTEATEADPGGLIFEIEEVGLRAVAPPVIQDLLSIVVEDQPIRLAVFNACHSYETARLSSDCIPHTIGLRDKIADAAAIKFTSALYLGLSKGYDVPKAFRLAVNKLNLLGVKATMLPTLFAGGAKVT